MKVLFFVASSIAALVPLGMSHAAGPLPPNPYIRAWPAGTLVVHYAVEQTVDHPAPADPAATRHFTSGTETLYIKGDRHAKVLRMGAPDGGARPALETVEIVTPEHVYSLDLTARTGTKIDNPRQAGRRAYEGLSADERKAFHARLVKTGGGAIDLLGVGERVGVETVLGRVCDVYELGARQRSRPAEDARPVDQGALYMKSWVWRGTGIPLRVHVEGPGWVREVRATKAEPDAEISENRFQVPAGVTVTDDRTRSEFARRQVLADFERLRTGKPQVIRIKVEPVPRVGRDNARRP